MKDLIVTCFNVDRDGKDYIPDNVKWIRGWAAYSDPRKGIWKPNMYMICPACGEKVIGYKMPSGLYIFESTGEPYKPESGHLVTTAEEETNV